MTHIRLEAPLRDRIDGTEKPRVASDQVISRDTKLAGADLTAIGSPAPWSQQIVASSPKRQQPTNDNRDRRKDSRATGRSDAAVDRAGSSDYRFVARLAPR